MQTKILVEKEKKKMRRVNANELSAKISSVIYGFQFGCVVFQN